MREAGQCPLWVKSGHDGGEFAMSALPPKADIAEHSLDVRPKADIFVVKIVLHPPSEKRR
jgi:hypothetical protein